MQPDLGPAVTAGVDARGQQPPCLVTADRAVPFARHVAVSGVDPDRRASGADAEFDDPLRRPGAVAAAPLLLGLPSLQGGDLAVDACQPHGVPDAQGVQALQVGRQVIEHVFDSRPRISLLVPGRPDAGWLADGAAGHPEYVGRPRIRTGAHGEGGGRHLPRGR
ncbi:hypothetical protein GCM10010129_02760 [Streptomyces fumigatiscleroticus]|nr:hypothetical protein GCM10010129_02760 [Streptomyces fumigatiscleroticus]